MAASRHARRRDRQSPRAVLHPGDVVARRRPHARAQARRDVRGVRSLRRRAAGGVGRAGRVPRRDAVPVAAGAAGRRAAAAAAVVDGEEGERPVHGRSDQPGPQDADRADRASRAARCTSSAPSSCGTALCYERLRVSNFEMAPVESDADAGVCGRLRRHLRGARHQAPAAGPARGAHRRRRRCGAGVRRSRQGHARARASRSTRRPTSWRATRRRFTSSCRRATASRSMSPTAARWRACGSPRVRLRTRVRGAAGGDRARPFSHCRVHAHNSDLDEWIARSVSDLR